MGFKDRLREKRVEANLTQAALAEKVSVTARTIQNYELGSRKPTKYEVVKKIAEALNTTPEYLLGNSGMLVLAAQEQGGAKAAREIDELVSEVSGMFAGAVSVKTRWTARCRLSPEPTGLQKKRTRSTRRKSTGKNRRKSKSGFWYRLFDIMVIPEGGGAMTPNNYQKSAAISSDAAAQEILSRLQNALGINVMDDCENLGSLKGMYCIVKRNRFIFLNKDLSPQMKRIVCAHEIGHDRLHRALAKKHGLQEFVLYDMATKPEYEANIVATEILLIPMKSSNTSTTTGTPRSRLRGQCTQTSTWLL